MITPKLWALDHPLNFWRVLCRDCQLIPCTGDGPKHTSATFLRSAGDTVVAPRSRALILASRINLGARVSFNAPRQLYLARTLP